MTKLKIKSTAIIEVALDLFREGIFKGTAGVRIEMSGSKLSFEDVTALMLELQSMQLPRSRIVRFTGSLVDDDDNFRLLVRSLYDYKYSVQCVVANGKMFSWMQWISWIIITTSEPVVLMMSNEVWYTPPIDQLRDVTLPPSPKDAFLFLCGRHSVDRVLAFMCETKQSWALL
jgi:hypothetical protein